jgi:TolB-like protein/Tfp pilus assembly protein PilF
VSVETPASEAGLLPARASRAVADQRIFFAELKRRNVLRVAVLYIAATWALSQGISQLTPALDLPDWATRAFLIACAIGFPIVLALAWNFEGILREIREIVGAGTPSSGEMAAGVTTAATNAETPVEIPHKSIAVLPFVDLSPAHDHEYFSDGIAEEILNALVKLRDLKVAGRTSSFSFKGRNEDLRGIGRTLAVAHVLEGSVRKHGDRVRITAQLIQTCDGYHLWSDNFDGDLSDVFELQERIARAIARELDVLLHGDQRLVPVATTEPEAYALYLEASSIYNRRDVAHLDYAAEMLTKAITLDPRFTRAYARLASAHALQISNTDVDATTIIEALKAEAAQASALDPGLGEPYTAIALACDTVHHFVEGHAAIEKAVQMQPRDPAVCYWAGALTLNVGYVALACGYFDRVLNLDPLYPAAMLWRGMGYLVAGDLSHAETLFVKAHDAGLVHAGMGMHEITAAHARPREAAAQFSRGMPLLRGGLPHETLEILANGVYGGAEARSQALALIERLVASQPVLMPGAIPYTLLLMGETQRALEIGMQFRSNNDILYFHRLWMPSMRSLRQSPQFRVFARDMGLVALWDRYGPPDGARRDAAGEYVWD